MKWEAKYFSSYDAWIIFEENGEVLTLENEEKVKLVALAPEMADLIQRFVKYLDCDLSDTEKMLKDRGIAILNKLK